MKPRVYTTSSAQSAHFHASSGEGYTTFAHLIEVGGKQVPGPTQFLVKTADLPEFYLLVGLANDAWERAKAVEKRENAT